MNTILMTKIPTENFSYIKLIAYFGKFSEKDTDISSAGSIKQIN